MDKRSFFSLFTTAIVGAFILSSGCKNGDSANSTNDSTEVKPVVNTVAEPEIPLTTPDGEPARFAFRSGEVEMVYSGDYQGVRRTIFTDYGMREWRLDSAVPSYEKMKVIPPQQLSIMTPNFHGAIDMRSKTGQKMPNNAYQKYREAWRTSSRPFGEIALERSGGIRLPDTTWMEKYHCRVYQQKGESFTRTIWTWGGLPIRESLVRTDGQEGSYVVELQSVKTDVVVQDSLFKFPANFEIQEVPYGSGR